MIGWIAARLLPVVPRVVVRAIASRYVAGEDLACAIRVVRGLNEKGFEATLDVLGEDASSGEVADKTVTEYVEVLDRIRSESLQSNISLKLTHLGLRLDRKSAQDRLARIIEAAWTRGIFVRIDMEDSSVTDVTLDIYRSVRDRWRNEPRASPINHPHRDVVGAVLQACLKRTEGDARRLAEEGANIRLCKGIYRESRKIAWRGREEVRKSFLAAAETLLAAADTYVAFATHDRILIERCLELVERGRVPKKQYEFQALLGVPIEDVLEDLVRRGIRVRVYVPFGVDWYPYASRRLRENPKIASYVIRQMFKPRRD